MLNQETIELKVSVYKFIIALLLGGNTGLLGILIRFVWKWYRKYKNAIMLYIEEHERLVDDYLRRHPEELNSPPSYFSRLPSTRDTTRRPERYKRPIEVDRPIKRELPNNEDE